MAGAGWQRFLEFLEESRLEKMVLEDVEQVELVVFYFRWNRQVTVAVYSFTPMRDDERLLLHSVQAHGIVLAMRSVAVCGLMRSCTGPSWHVLLQIASGRLDVTSLVLFFFCTADTSQKH